MDKRNENRTGHGHTIPGEYHFDLFLHGGDFLRWRYDWRRHYWWVISLGFYKASSVEMGKSANFSEFDDSILYTTPQKQQLVA